MKLMLAAVLSLALLPCSSEAREYRPVHNALTAMSVHKTERGEDKERRKERLGVYAEIINRVAKTRHEKLLLLAVGECESHFTEQVCEGRELGDEGKAYGCWQSHEHDREGGIEAQAKRAIEHLRKAENFCRAREGAHVDRITGAVSLYATGKTCQWEGAPKRVAAYKRHERHF